MRLAALTVTAAAAALAVAAPGQARSIAHRTAAVTAHPGGSLRPVVSDNGRYVAFDSDAANLVARDPNGATRDIFVRDLRTGRVRLMTRSVSGGGANNESTAAAVSSTGNVLAFSSKASNLYRGDANGYRDVFATGGGIIGPVSLGLGGEQSDGDSGEPDVSGDGRRIVFTSAATNLVPGDTNGVRDVFVRDLRTFAIRRVSVRAGGGQADGASRAPSISPDGRFVTFFSRAHNLVAGDTNGVGDVFLADLRTGRLERVSRSSGGRQQNKAVRSPFVQVSDVSRDGRYVVFDSDASNLVRGDRGGDTDVFLRDVRRNRTVRISKGLGREANSDSIYPRITPNGRFISFASFASNLFLRDAYGPDSFVYDRRSGYTTLIDVDNAGAARYLAGTRLVQHRPGLSADGTRAAFTTSARLISADRNRRPDVYTRRLDAPVARIHVRHGRYRLGADDRHARLFLCRVGRFGGLCRRRASLAFLKRGRRYRFVVRAWGPGMLVGPPVAKRVRR